MPVKECGEGVMAAFSCGLLDFPSDKSRISAIYEKGPSPIIKCKLETATVTI